jgi:hypothetical protein
MPRKKVKVKISFNGEKFSPIKSTLEKDQLLNTFIHGEAPQVKVWTDQEVFLGKTGEVTHLSWVNLKMITDGKYNFQNALAKSSYYTVSFEKFSAFETLAFSFEDDKVVATGALSLTFTVLDDFHFDIYNSGLMYFDELSFRVKGSSDILNFSLYGTEWEKERADEDDFRNGISRALFNNRPQLEFLKK